MGWGTVSDSRANERDEYDPSSEDIKRIFRPKPTEQKTPIKIVDGKPQTEIDLDELNIGPGNPEMRMH